MDSNLIIFIDAFPNIHLEWAPFLKSFPCQGIVQSGIGYTVNLSAELFSGRRPDEVGFFNKWTYAEDGPLAKYQVYEKFLKVIEKNRFFEKKVREKYKKVLKTSSIPICLVPWLKKKCMDVKSDMFSYANIFNTNKEFVIIEPTGYTGIDQDESIYLRAKNEIQKNANNIFCYFLGLDSVAHTYGISSIDVKNKIQTLDVWINELYQLFLTKQKNVNFIVVSDHGMADVHRLVEPSIWIKKIKKNAKGRVIYFIDSVMVRFWFQQKEDIHIIEEFLGEWKDGRVVSYEEREKFGITKRDGGDILFMLDEGKLFFPDFFMGKYRKQNESARAMHGYLPLSETLQGILLYRGKEKVSIPKVIETKDVYRWLCEVCNIEMKR